MATSRVVPVESYPFTLPWNVRPALSESHTYLPVWGTPLGDPALFWGQLISLSSFLLLSLQVLVKVQYSRLQAHQQICLLLVEIQNLLFQPFHLSLYRKSCGHHLRESEEISGCSLWDKRCLLPWSKATGFCKPSSYFLVLRYGSSPWLAGRSTCVGCLTIGFLNSSQAW